MILLFFTGCEQKDDNEIFVLENKTQTDVKNIKQQFEAVNLTDAFLKEAFKVKWDKYEVIDNPDGSLTYEFSTNLYSKFDLVDDGLIKSKNTKKIFSVYKLLAKDSPDGTISFEILKFTGNNRKELKDISLSDLSDFNGAINYSTHEGTYVKDEIYNYGILTNSITQKPDQSLVSKAPPITDEYVWVMEMSVVDYYTVCLSCGGGIFNPENWYFKSRKYTPVWRLVPRTTGVLYGQLYHSHNDDPLYTGPTGGSRGVDTHLDEIFPTSEFEDNDKLNCTYEQLSKNTGLQELLKGFMGKATDANAYHLIMDVLPNPNCPHDHANACTFGSFEPTDKYVTIKFDSDYINDPTIPTISIARTIIHESIHAALFLEVRQWNAGVTPETPYNVLLDDYRKRKIGSSHPIMSANYVSTIAQTLRDVHGLIDPNFITYINNNYPGWDWNKYYEFHAYQGLEGTKEYNTHKSSSNWVIDANIYLKDADNNSTKTPVCEE